MCPTTATSWTEQWIDCSGLNRDDWNASKGTTALSWSSNAGSTGNGAPLRRPSFVRLRDQKKKHRRALGDAASKKPRSSKGLTSSYPSSKSGINLEHQLASSGADVTELSVELAKLLATIEQAEERWLELSELEP